MCNLSTVSKFTKAGGRDDLVAKGACCQAWRAPSHPHVVKREKSTSESYALTSTWSLWQMCFCASKLVNKHAGTNMCAYMHILWVFSSGAMSFSLFLSLWAHLQHTLCLPILFLMAWAASLGWFELTSAGYKGTPPTPRPYHAARESLRQAAHWGSRPH